jgi:hypothetical protein
MELFTFMFLKESWTKEDALEEVSKQNLTVLSLVEDDKLLVCVIKEIPEDSPTAEVIMLSDSVYCICKIPEEMKKIHSEESKEDCAVINF